VANIIAGIAVGEHGLFVALKHVIEADPPVHRREVSIRAGVRVRGHDLG
jgi:hypothetical protein